jgi:uncharacterized protein YjiS (DUF1127 family)
MKRTITMSTQNTPAASLLATLRRAIVAPVVGWYNRQRMFEELNGLSDRALADIGLTREQIPTFVKQAYRQEHAASAANLPPLRAESHPAASNDPDKQRLAA